MRLPVLRGLIKRRLLVNFRVAPEAIQPLLPAPLRPKLHAGHAIAGICLIRLEQIRPLGVPAIFGLSSENAAHRIAVVWDDDRGAEREGVFIPRRDTGSRLNQLAGGRLFPGEHHRAAFEVTDDGDRVELRMSAADGVVSLRVAGQSATSLPTTSCFTSLEETSAFFAAGSLGFSVTRDCCRLDGLRLETPAWQVAPFAVDDVTTSFFADSQRFPSGSVTFDHALIMREVEHEWHQADDLIVGKPGAVVPSQRRQGADFSARLSAGRRATMRAFSTRSQEMKPHVHLPRLGLAASVLFFAFAGCSSLCDLRNPQTGQPIPSQFNGTAGTRAAQPSADAACRAGRCRCTIRARISSDSSSSLRAACRAIRSNTSIARSANVAPEHVCRWRAMRVLRSRSRPRRRTRSIPAEVTVNDRNRMLDYTNARQLVQVCDFEGHVEWVLGVRFPGRFRVTELTDPPRVVVDVKTR